MKNEDCLYDIVILGNGILGLSVALELSLQDSSLNIAVIGPENRPDNGTLAAGAMLGCYGETNSRTVIDFAAKEKFILSLESNNQWADWVSIINSGSSNNLKIKKGTFIILNSRSGTIDDLNFQSIKDIVENLNVKFSLNGKSIHGLIKPIPDSRPLQTLHLHEEGYIDPLELINSIQTYLSNTDKITFINESASNIKYTNNKIELVYTSDNKKVVGKNYLLAMGSHSQTIISQISELEYKIPKILHANGCALLLKCKKEYKNVIRTPNRAGACGLHLVPRDSNHIYLGATNYITPAPEKLPKTRYIHYLIKNATEQIDQDINDYEIEKIYTACRPFSVDSFPLLGASETIKNLWIATGTYRDGLHQSPTIAKKMAKSILNNRNDFHSIFSPERKIISYHDAEYGSEQFAKETMSAGYEHSISLPRIGWDEMLESMLNDKAKKIYEQLDYNHSLPVEFILMLDRYPETISYYKNFLTNNALLGRNQMPAKDTLEPTSPNTQ